MIKHITLIVASLNVNLYLREKEREREARSQKEKKVAREVRERVAV